MRFLGLSKFLALNPMRKCSPHPFPCSSPGGCGLLHHIGKGTLGHQEDLGALHVEGQGGHEVCAVIACTS